MCVLWSVVMIGGIDAAATVISCEWQFSSRADYECHQRLVICELHAVVPQLAWGWETLDDLFDLNETIWNETRPVYHVYILEYYDQLFSWIEPRLMHPRWQTTFVLSLWACTIWMIILSLCFWPTVALAFTFSFLFFPLLCLFLTHAYLCVIGLSMIKYKPPPFYLLGYFIENATFQHHK